MVMCHEVSHVLQRHVNRQLSKQLLNCMAMLCVSLSFDFGLFEVYLSEKFENMYKLNHSRKHESRADEQGLNLLHQSGFGYEEGPRMIVNLEKTIKKFTKDGAKKTAEKTQELFEKK